MSNEQYLIVSYFVVAIICLGTALAVYLLFRRSFLKIIQTLSSKHLFQVLRKLFLVGIVLPALFGFFTVSFRSCSMNTYEKIIEERGYLIQRNQMQLSSSLFYIVAALFIWGVIIGGLIFVIRRSGGKKYNNSV